MKFLASPHIHYKKKPSLEEDLLDHLESNEDYCFEKLVSNENKAFGVAFLRKDFAALMGKHGHLIQLDATHKVIGFIQNLKSNQIQ